MNERISMTGEEQKLVMLNILFRFADFCERNGLAYFLDAGTLLGAVRHKGYIPWDDDIDVNMPYEDYVKFIAMTKEKKGYMEDHLLVEYPTDTIYPFLKISDVRTILVEFPNKYPMEVGVYIDIFPKVGIANDSLSTKLVCKTSYFLHLCQWFNKFSIYAWKNNGNLGKKIIAAVGRKLIVKPNIPVKLQERFISQYARRHPLNQCKYVTTLTNGEYVNRCPKEVFADYIYLDFENKKFRAPKDYNTYLPCLYGASFMQLPPKEKRRVHNTIVYFKNREGKNDINNELERNDIKLNNCDTIETGGGNPLVSIIVPVYNVENYLRQCVNSILNQSYGHIEVILVDDGSTDRSPVICDQFKRQDSRVHVIHKKNGGQSSARNAGIDAAIGQYIGFVDSDDTITKDFYKILVNNVEHHTIPCNSVVRVNESGSLLGTVQDTDSCLYGSKEYVRSLLLYTGDCSVCSKLFPKEVFENFRFDENLLNEDFKFMAELGLSQYAVKYTGMVGYYYLYRTGSTTTAFGKSASDTIKNAKVVGDEILNLYPELDKEVSGFRLYQHMIYLLCFPFNKPIDEEYRKICKFVRKNIWNNLNNNNLSIVVKCVASVQCLEARIPAYCYQKLRKIRKKGTHH